MTYVDGFVIPVHESKKDAYRAMAAKAAPIFIEHGALAVVENWGDDLMKGHTTDYYRAVQAGEGESVVFSWITWPSKEARDAGNAAAMADERFDDMMGQDVFDGKRMIFSGFQTIVSVEKGS